MSIKEINGNTLFNEVLESDYQRDIFKLILCAIRKERKLLKDGYIFGICSKAFNNSPKNSPSKILI